MPVPNVSEQWAEDVIVTITEGGSNYWADFKRTADGKLELVESEASHPDGQLRRIVLDRDAIQKGIDVLTSKPVKVAGRWTRGWRARRCGGSTPRSGRCSREYLGNILAAVVQDQADIDATEADIVIQAALFGELVYG
jgi:hypothetical protein